MHLLIDTREKLPWVFNDTVNTTIQALPAGDYRLVSSSIAAVIERKSEDDLVNTLVHSRKRFQRELAKLRDYDHACVVVESSIAALLRHEYRSEIDPTRLLDMVAGVEVDWGIPVVWAGDRPAAIVYAEAWFRRVARRGG